MKNKIYRIIALSLFSLLLAIASSSAAFGAATIVIVNNDPAGVGFNDTTAAVPVGGNTGTTIGQQRLIAFQAAAATWGATLTSGVTIRISAQWTALTCTATTAVLGSAGSTEVFRDFGGAPFAGSWYGKALTNKLIGSDADPATADINANFNVNLGGANCLTGTFFYLGLDGVHGANVDLVTVLTHEFAHGLGFQTFTNGSTGALLASFPSSFDRFLLDDSTGKSWFNMTPAERITSAINNGKLVWDGPQVAADVPSVLSFGIPVVKINSPAGIAGNYDAGTASFGGALTAGGVTASIVQALDPADPAGPLTTDGCDALTNAAAIAGNIALIDRGTCGFTVKAKNAQNAGAVAVIIVNSAAGSPAPGLGGTDATVTIPTVSVTQSDGALIKAQLGSGVNGSVKTDNTIRAGADTFGKARMYAPNPFQSGSSVSHWDTIEFPNQLMEPAINTDLTHNVTPPSDLTFSELQDVGWVPSSLPSTISVTAGDSQTAIVNTPFAVPFSVTINPALTSNVVASPSAAGTVVTWTVNPSGGGAGGTFAGTGTRSATSTTNGAGVAFAPTFTANGTTGTYTMNATVAGAGTAAFVSLTNNAPTAAGVSISGRVLTADGRGLMNARVVITDSHGTARTVTTGSFGYYRFDDVTAGGTYVVGVVSKRYNYATRVVQLDDNLADMDFVPEP